MTTIQRVAALIDGGGGAWRLPIVDAARRDPLADPERVVGGMAGRPSCGRFLGARPRDFRVRREHGLRFRRESDQRRRVDAAILRFDAQGHLIGEERWGGAADDYPVDAVADAAGPPSLDGGAGSANYAIFVAKLGW